MDIYEPREDSYLLAQSVEKYAFGKLLEIGCGSGMQCFTAIKKDGVKKVLGVDINKAAIKACKYQIGKLRNIKFRKSDMFSRVFGKFDTIICNPPYLPNDPRVKDVALDGGKKGYEFTREFLKKAGKHMTKYGQILLLISSLTKKEQVEDFIKDGLFDFEIVDTKRFDDGEELYVYKIKKNQTLMLLEKKGVKKIKRFAHGKRGNIFTGKFKGKKIAIKLQRSDSPSPGSINNEIVILQLLNTINIGPKMLLWGNNWFVYKFAEGKFIEDAMQDATKTRQKKILKEILIQMFRLDKLKINKEEMTHPQKHIVIGKKITLLDFERAKPTEKPQNVTQFCEYMTGKLTLDLKFELNRDKILGLARIYKHKITKENFDKILGEVTGKVI